MIKKGQNLHKNKIRELKDATKDNLFLNDLKEISESFITVDSEGLDDAG